MNSKIFTNVQDFWQTLEDEGYTWGAPSYDAQEIDKQVANNAKCEKCGYNGLCYRPFHKPDSYRAFILCPDCGHIDEF